jgi:signal transduction histidine kinase/DNA-binding LacI/PurR family transcriptional regulator/DNA-binding response OmpR family regulator
MQKTFGATRRERPTIGVLAGWQAYEGALNSFLSPLLNGIQAAARHHSCNLLLACGVGHRGDYQPDDVHPAWPILMPDTDFVPVGPWNTDGLIVISPVRSKSRSEYLKKLSDAGFPVVFISPGEHGPTLVFDNEGGVRQAITHLVGHGHEHIAFIAGLTEESSDSEYRLKAYKTVVAEYGLSADPRLIAVGGFYTLGGYQAMQQIIDSGVYFSAVLAFNDEAAIGAMQALRENGRRIPEDVAIIGFDDRLDTLVQTPPLTSVRQPLTEMGYQAFELVLQYIDQDVDRPYIIHVPAQLSIRKSCGCLSGARLFNGLAAIGLDNEASILQKLALAMREVLPARDESLDSGEIIDHCERLAEAFLASLESWDYSVFYEALENVLMWAESVDENPHDWQAVLSVLRHNLPLIFKIENLQQADRMQVEEMLHQARVIISESAQRRYVRNKVLQFEITDQLGRMGTRLHTALDDTNIFEILREVLPRIGIRQAHLAFFEPHENGVDAVAWSRLYTLVDESTKKSVPERFLSRSFPPRDLYSSDVPFQLALLPLIIRDGLSGYMVFDAGWLEPCAAIVRQIESALRSARLYQDAAEGRRLAEEANRLKGSFLSMVSHELRTPLNLIVGLSEILTREPEPGKVPLPSAYWKDVKQIHSSAEHLGWLIRDVLDMASSEAGQLSLAYEQVDLRAELLAVANIGQQLAQEKGLSWQAEIPDEIPAIWGDRTRLRQVTLNLVSNAVKFTTIGGVTLIAGAQDDKVVVSVRDTGLGISPDEQDFVFDEFHQSSRTLARGYSGMGLGLAICKRLVELHGGKIALRSSGKDGEGSTFYFTLPILSKQDAMLGQQLESFSENTQHSVLVLSENPNSIEHVRDYLTRQGFDVETLLVDENASLRSRLLDLRPGALVLDLNLASERGWEILRILKSSPATLDAPVLFYSLSLESNTGSWMEINTLTKPVSMDELARTLARHGLLAGGEEKTILIVDDDAKIREMNARIVQSQSPAYRVLKARNGVEALEILRQRSVDLVLLDLMMPELDGFEVLEAMREEEMTRDIPVIILTAKLLTELDMLRLSRGVATVLKKGLFSVDETLAHIEEALALNHRLGNEAQRLVRKAMAYMHEHYHVALTRENIARYVGISEDYLTRCFQQELRMPPMTYLTRYRINQAKSFLAAGDMSVSEVAEAVGFSSEAYFNRIFRREVRIPPGAYRRGQRPSTEK